MTSINPHYTIHYSQPDTYRFSHDSVFLARRAFDLFKTEIHSEWRVLDLCAGCGVVGMDFLFHCQLELGFTPKECDFLEVQEEYLTHFRRNLSRLPKMQTAFRFLNENYNTQRIDQYNLILCNPPYFELGTGKLSPHEFKNRCRFFIDSSHEELLANIERSLRPDGRALVLTRNPNPPTNKNLKTQELEPIRGTPLILYAKT